LEDEVFVNMAAAQELQDAGCGVRAFFTIEDANGSVDKHLPDAAVLDVNIAGKMSYPIAERLSQTGIPFVFFTSYDRSALPESWIGSSSDTVFTIPIDKSTTHRL
jgi:DNA-binding response OmpR family regulator